MLNRAQNLRKASSIEHEIRQHFNLANQSLKAKVVNVEHHRSHLASAFFASSFHESAILSIDGFGDFSSTMLAIGKGNQIEVLDTVSYPHSLGLFYTTLTQFLGFPHYGDEYKVMGLAPYGVPKHAEKLRMLVKLKPNGLFELDLKYFNHPKNGVKMAWENGVPNIETLFTQNLEDLLGMPRRADENLTKYHKDIAASVQLVCEEVIFHILNFLHQQTGLRNLCVAGGVAQNSVANGKLKLKTLFENVYIPPAGHDAGTAIGAALWVYNQIEQKPRTLPMLHGYFGSKFDNNYIEKLLTDRKIPYTRPSHEVFYEEIVGALTNEGVVGWFQGRAEFGPRALGHRSILADPRNTNAKDIINSKIKRRESFRPFAPSILSEFVKDYFEQDESVPFMEKVLKIKRDKRNQIPAVTHMDGTGRLQSVHKETDERFYNLISSFYKFTGVPILLNTSFNENEPIVNTPEEALDCFLRTRMDMLVMEDIIITK